MDIINFTVNYLKHRNLGMLKRDNDATCPIDVGMDLRTNAE